MTALVYGRRLVPGATAALVCAMLGMLIVERTSSVRFIVAGSLLLVLLMVAIDAPASAVVLTVALLPFIAVLRRILIEFDPWRSIDPLLLVAPIVVVVLLMQPFVLQRRQFAGDGMSVLVVGILVLTILQTVNPRGGSLTAGVTSLLFAGMPLLWFFVGRELVDDEVLLKILAVVVPLAFAVACYGLLQTESGFPHWDAEWIATSGYSSLVVGNRIRAFGTFSSAAEYAVFLSVAVIASLTLARRLRFASLAFLPLIVIALFLDSSRGIVVVTLVALVVVAGARTGNVRWMVALAGVAACGVFYFAHAYGNQLQARAAETNNSLVTHQVNGLLNPLDPQQSTLLLHWDGLIKGFSAGLHSPVGNGIAATTLAGAKLGGNSQSTELDVTDAFVGLGIVGGALYVAFVALALVRAAQVALRRRDALSLAALGILVVSVGQWRNGGYYAVSALVWILLGWLAAQSRTEPEAA